MATALLSAPSAFTITVAYATSNASAQESSETINLTLSSPTNATLGTPSLATMTILDDETPPPPSEEFYSYDQIGNMLSKTSVGAYSYPRRARAAPPARSASATL